MPLIDTKSIIVCFPHICNKTNREKKDFLPCGNSGFQALICDAARGPKLLYIQLEKGQERECLLVPSKPDSHLEERQVLGEYYTALPQCSRNWGMGSQLTAAL